MNCSVSTAGALVSHLPSVLASTDAPRLGAALYPLPPQHALLLVTQSNNSRLLTRIRWRTMPFPPLTAVVSLHDVLAIPHARPFTIQ